MSAKYEVTDDRIRELVKADAEGRLAIIPCKYGESMWRVKPMGSYTSHPGKIYCVQETCLTKFNLHSVLFDEEYKSRTFMTYEEAERERVRLTNESIAEAKAEARARALAEAGDEIPIEEFIPLF